MVAWDPDEADRLIGDWQANLEARAARAQQFAARVQSVVATGQAEHGLVVATVNHAGQLVDLRIDDRARDWSGTRIAASVLAAAGAARQSLADQVRAISTDLGIGDA